MTTADVSVSNAVESELVSLSFVLAAMTMCVIARRV